MGPGRLLRRCGTLRHWLYEPFAHAPLVLRQQHAAELRETARRVVESAQDRLPILNRESDHRLLGLQRDDLGSDLWLVSSIEQDALGTLVICERAGSRRARTYTRPRANWPGAFRRPFDG
jgi:hypothetical protein